MSRLSGRNFSNNILGEFVQVETLTLTITDESEAAFSGGVPDGFTDGKVSAEVEVELTAKYFKVVHSAAKSAGSYRELPLDDIVCYANTGDEEKKVEAFGVKWKVQDILNIDPSSTDASKFKMTGLVTSPLFVKIDGVSYLSTSDTQHVL